MKWRDLLRLSGILVTRYPPVHIGFFGGFREVLIHHCTGMLIEWGPIYPRYIHPTQWGVPGVEGRSCAPRILRAPYDSQPYPPPEIRKVGHMGRKVTLTGGGPDPHSARSETRKKVERAENAQRTKTRETAMARRQTVSRLSNRPI